MPTAVDVALWRSLADSVPDLTPSDAHAWLTARTHPSALSVDERVMRSIHAFNILGYFDGDMAETLERVAAKYQLPVSRVKSMGLTYAERHPLRISQTGDGDLWRQSPALAMLENGLLGATAADMQAMGQQTRSMTVAPVAPRVGTAANAIRNVLGQTGDSEVDWEEVRKAYSDGSMERLLAERYRSGDIVIRDVVTGDQIDPASVERVEFMTPVEDIQALDDPAVVRVTTISGATITGVPDAVVPSYRVPFGLVPPHYTCGYSGCRLRLNRTYRSDRDRGGLTGYTWEHGRLTPAMGVPPHDPVPVPDELLSARVLCDFCLCFDPVWVFGCEALVVSDVEDGMPWKRHVDGDGWLACADCRRDIEDGQIAFATQRYLDGLVQNGHFDAVPPYEIASMVERVRADVVVLHDEFIRGRTLVDFPVEEVEG